MSIDEVVVPSVVAISEAPIEERCTAPVYAATIFLGAMLLFQSELIISKYILPWFGGAAAVWTTAMLLFQVLLLAGYGYAHVISTRLTNSMVKLHLALVGISVLVMAMTGSVWPSPVTPGGAWKPQSPDHTLANILFVLLASVGLPFFVLSTTGPLVQSWFSRATSRSPYRLYAVSNAGSLLGLLTYPFVVEPLLTLRVQAWLWCGLYLLYAAGITWCARAAIVSSNAASQSDCSGESPSECPVRHYLMWTGLAGCASLALLAVTNKICHEVAAVPLLWVLPLCLYLVSLIICFGRQSWYKRGAFHALFAGALSFSLLGPATGLIWVKLGSFALLLFAVSMVCHGELARLKPAATHLTAFYVCVSGGAALGGILAGAIAPLVFASFWEFDAALGGTALLVIVLLLQDKESWFYKARVATLIPIIAVAIGPQILIVNLAPPMRDWLASWHYFPAALALGLPVLLGFAVFRGGDASDGVPFRPAQVAAVAALLLLAYLFARVKLADSTGMILEYRNFYGVLRVQETPADWRLIHGTTIHGAQWKEPRYRRTPTTYYGNASAIGQLMAYHPKRVSKNLGPMRFGIVGLGVGTLAAYGLPGDYMRFYELNPGVLPLVQGPNAHFSFLNDSAAKLDVVLGDARLSLERELAAGQPQHFDLLVLDAFNGDAIPTHLLTKEAVRIYLQHLSGPDAVLAVHISASAVDLRPVLAGIAREFNLKGRLVVLQGDANRMTNTWVLLAAHENALTTPGLAENGTPLPWDRAVLWTDDFSNIVTLVQPFRL